MSQITSNFIFLHIIIYRYVRVCENVYGKVDKPKRKRWCPRRVMVKAMDCGIVVREFELQSRYYVHIRANTLGKCMNPLILPAMG